MNGFDVLIILALAAGATWGFVKGVVHQVIGFGLIYVAIIVATFFYDDVSPALGTLVKIQDQAAGALAFLLLLILTINIIGFALRNIRKGEVRVFRLVNQLGGMTFGFALAGIWVALIIALLFYAGSSPIQWRDPSQPQLATFNWESIRLGFQHGLNTSPLVAAFSSLLPVIIGAVSPIVPTGDILNVFVVR